MDAASESVVRELNRERREWLQHIRDANSTSESAARWRPANISAVYDEEEDILFITLGTVQEAITESVEGIGFRVDPETLDIVGVEILDLSKHLDQQIVRSLFGLAVNASSFTVESPQTTDVLQTIRDLIPV